MRKLLNSNKPLVGFLLIVYGNMQEMPEAQFDKGGVVSTV